MKPRYLLVIAALFFVCPNISTAQTTSDNSEKNKIEIAFPGGPIADFVEMISRPYVENGETKKLNVILKDSARSVRLPKIEIKTTMDGILSCLEALSGNDYQISIHRIGADNDVVLINVESMSELEVVVISAKKILGTLDEADVLAAIDIGFKMYGGTPEIELKLHKETGLLFVRGNRSETQLVHDIVNELKTGQGLTDGPMGGGVHGDMSPGMGGMSGGLGGMSGGLGGGGLGGMSGGLGGGGFGGRMSGGSGKGSSRFGAGGMGMGGGKGNGSGDKEGSGRSPSKTKENGRQK